MQCLSSWCRHIGSCLNQTLKWETLCSRKFYRFRYSQFYISTVDEGLNASYIRNIHVKNCEKTYLGSWRRRFKFTIKTTGFRCQSEKANACKQKLYIKLFPCQPHLVQDLVFGSILSPWASYGILIFRVLAVKVIANRHLQT